MAAEIQRNHLVTIAQAGRYTQQAKTCNETRCAEIILPRKFSHPSPLKKK